MYAQIYLKKKGHFLLTTKIQKLIKKKIILAVINNENVHTFLYNRAFQQKKLVP